jgi:hypothetical protein
MHCILGDKNYLFSVYFELLVIAQLFPFFLLIAGVTTWYLTKPYLCYFFMLLLINYLNRALLWGQCSGFIVILKSISTVVPYNVWYTYTTKDNDHFHYLRIWLFSFPFFPFCFIFYVFKRWYSVWILCGKVGGELWSIPS